jgi:vitamin B12 transporter
MKRLYYFFALQVLTLTAFGQTTVSGTITEQSGAGIPGVNVSIKDSYDGATTDVNGKFEFVTEETGDHVIVASLIGYDPIEQMITLNGTPQTITLKLKEQIKQLDAVVISAGSFEASDENKMVILRPLDIVTTAGANGDIYGALMTLPGTQQVGETEGLFVRGGDASETKTIIDGMYVSNPYFSSVPDVPQRGRFSPFQFKGTFFSTGGYSAQYGQAMSSALILESQDLPSKSTSNIGIMTVGAGLGHEHLWNQNTSLGIYGNYTNLAAYYALIEQNRDWTHAPEALSGSLTFRHKNKKNGMLKAFGSYTYSGLSLRYPDINDPTGATRSNFSLYNNNLFANASFKQRISANWVLFSAASYSNNDDNMHVDSNAIDSYSDMLQGRVMLTHPIGTLSSFRIGGEILQPNFSTKFNQYESTFDDVYSAGFMEADVYLSKNLVSRLGGRFDYSNALGSGKVSPRISLAYKTGDKSQFSFAYGDFYQNPDKSYVTSTTNIDFEKATHYILNFQYVDNKRTFRAEAYYKQYNDLVKFVLDDTTNSGNGYARGFDLFWRDKKTFKNTDYWISYSFLDTKRNWKDYPSEVVPPFAATHTATLVYKYFIDKLNCGIGFTYTYATGRHYFNPNKITPDDFMSDRTKDYQNFSINGSWLTSIRDHFTVIAFSCTNVLGIENVYSYRYSYDGTRREPVMASAKRAFFIGMFISIGEDNTNTD